MTLAWKNPRRAPGFPCSLASRGRTLLPTALAGTLGKYSLPLNFSFPLSETRKGMPPSSLNPSGGVRCEAHRGIQTWLCFVDWSHELGEEASVCSLAVNPHL